MLGVVAYLYFWQPYFESVGQLRLEVPQQRATLAWMDDTISKSEEWLNKSIAPKNDQPLLTVIESRAVRAGIKPTIGRVQPIGSDQVSVWFQEVVADQWFAFVDYLSEDGIEVDALTMTRASQGLVNVKVTFER